MYEYPLLQSMRPPPLLVTGRVSGDMQAVQACLGANPKPYRNSGAANTQGSGVWWADGGCGQGSGRVCNGGSTSARLPGRVLVILVRAVGR